MSETCDVLIIGAGTSGSYFGWLMAKKGFKVIILEKDPREKVGKRLDVFHLDSDKLPGFGITPPKENDPEFIGIIRQNISYDPDGNHPKVIKYPFHVMRLNLFINKLFSLAETDGVKYEFSTTFKSLIYKDNRIVGALAEKNNEEKEYFARLVVDASGIKAGVRTTLPIDHDVENFKVGPREMFYVVLRYIKWLEKDHPKTINADNWTYYKTWIAPSCDPQGAILGIGHSGSHDEAEETLKEFLSAIPLPPYEIDYFERGVTPFRRPPYSLVGDGFLCLGDSACITKPSSGEGIIVAWNHCKIAADVAGKALRQNGYITAKQLWDINMTYFRSQGAKFAGLLATVSGATNTSKKENIFLFKNNIIFSEQDMTEMNRDGEIHLTMGKIVKIFLGLVRGVLTGNYSIGSVTALAKSVNISGKIRNHYENFPQQYEDFGTWKKTADELWNKADVKM